MASPEENIVSRNFALVADEKNSKEALDWTSPFLLGEVCVDPTTNCLRAEHRSIHVEPRHMAVLCCLARHAGDTVGRSELLAAGWGERDVNDESLTESISRLRRALGDSAKQARFIKTVPKKGYLLLVAPIRAPAPSPARSTPQASARNGSSVAIRPGDRSLAAGARQAKLRHLQFLAAVCAVVALYGGSQQSSGSGQADVRIDIALLSDPNPAWLDIDPDF